MGSIGYNLKQTRQFSIEIIKKWSGSLRQNFLELVSVAHLLSRAIVVRIEGFRLNIGLKYVLVSVMRGLNLLGAILVITARHAHAFTGHYIAY